MKWDIYNRLKENSFIAQHVGNRIKFYEYPPTEKMEGVYIVIDPLEPPRPGDFADNTPLTDDYLFQLEVWSLNGELTEKVAKQVRNVMLKMGFNQGSGMDEYDKDTKIYRDARQYSGKFYDPDII